MSAGAVVVIGGTGGLGREIARHYLAAGREVVISSRDPDRAGTVAGELGGAARGIGLELTRPEQVGPPLSGIGPVDHLVLAAIDRGSTTIDAFEVGPAAALAILKLAGYLTVVHALRSRLSPDGSVVVFGGQARVRPYPGSTMVSTVNGGVVGMVRTLSVELAPVRVNAIHPGIVGDSPFWAGKPAPVLETFRAGTLTGRLASVADVVGAVTFLLENPSVNGVDLAVDGGWR
ncbi:MAG: SDR family oxidoreductase [Micromonosporaceae bacterium]|nr:SDR family oxidoreductase [Micromonosporaceae bacterium]